IDIECKFTLVKFNNRINQVINNLDLKEVKPLTVEDYRPDRTTALYDALGETISQLSDQKNVLMVIVTDGHENASQEYNHQEVTEMLDEKQKKNNWSYVYLCNDLKTSSQGESLGLTNSGFASNCIQPQSCFKSYLCKDVNMAIKNYRTKGISVQSQLNSV
ncbi:unnamed protein product, partial [marine sediment metagenome]